MVRRPAALLGATGLAAAQAYLLAAAALPELHPVRLSLIVARVVGSAAILLGVAVAAAALGTESRRAWLLAVVALIGVAIVDLAHVGAGASVIEAVAYAAVGAGLAFGLLEPALVLALPLVVAIVDIASIAFGGPSATLAHGGPTQRGDALSLETPDWGNGLTAGRIGFSDIVVAGALIAWARHYGLRTWSTVGGMWVAMAVASLLNIALRAAVPVLPLMALAFFGVNADRLPALWRRAARR